MITANRWTRVPAAASLLLMGVFLMGAEKGGCGPVEPPVESSDQCVAAADCEGVSHVMCLGDWQCVEGACRWKCDLPPVACLADSECAEGEFCKLEAQCPECTKAQPPCMAACTIVGSCQPIETPPVSCVVGGCSSELCLPEGQGDIASPCWYAEWFKCLQFSQCGAYGADGGCAWAKTPGFEKCMAGLTCGADNACAAGYVCQDGTCVKSQEPTGCHSNQDCKAGTHCSVSDGMCGTDPNCPMCAACYGECVPDEQPLECQVDSDCQAGFVCLQTPECPPCVYEDPACKVACWSKGQCVPKPVETCMQDADCAEGQYCRIDTCAADANCVPGYAGATDAGGAPDAAGAPMPNCVCQGTCQPKVEPGRCVSDADCPEGQRCFWTGACPPCDCGADNSDCACPACMPAQTGFCGPYCDPNHPEACGNGIDDDCDGLVDEDCVSPKSCVSNADCAPYEFCDFQGPVYDEAGNLSCCPPNARCTGAIPPCGAGECRMQPGFCWLDGDCALGERCDGAIRCPPNAECFVADQPGRCVVVEKLPCTGDADCPKGQVCEWSGGCPVCPCTPDDPSCECPMCAPPLNGWCVPGGCVDLDADGSCAGSDCDDANPAVSPLAMESCDGLDNDCNGLVDEGCSPQCFSDLDCATYEYCRMVYMDDATGVACCPPNAFCDGTIPACGGGTCVLQPGLCWSDGDCGYGQKCEGAIACPAGAMCFAAERPGQCVEAGLRCISDADCTEGEFCDLTRNPISACCLAGDQPCLMYLPACEGICSLMDGRCWNDADCANGGTCQGARQCPEGALCIIADAAGTCVEPPLPYECKVDSDCAMGQGCRAITVCPPCTMQDPACAMPCAVEYRCMNECTSNGDCAPSQYCEITRCDPATGERCIGPYYCTPYGLD